MLFFLFLFPFLSPCHPRQVAALVPAEVNLPRAVGSLLHQGLVKLSSGAGVDVGPAKLAVVLKTGDVSTEKRSKLAPAACALTLIAQLIVQDVRLHLHLQDDKHTFTQTQLVLHA